MSVRQGETLSPCCLRVFTDAEDEKRAMRLELQALRAEVARLKEVIDGLTEHEQAKHAESAADAS